MNELTLIRVLRNALKILSDRFLTLLVFLATLGIGLWAMATPDLHRDGILFGFGILYLLTLRAERKPNYEPAKPDLVVVETDGIQRQKSIHS